MIRKLIILVFLILLLPTVMRADLTPGGAGGNGGPASAVFSPGPVSIIGNSGNGTDQINAVSVNGVLEATAYGLSTSASATYNQAVLGTLWTAAITGHRAIHIPNGVYPVACPVNFTSGVPGNGAPVGSIGTTVYGDGYGTQLQLQCPTNTLNGIDFTGSDYYNLRDLMILGGTSTTNAPKVAVLQARIGPPLTAQASRPANAIFSNVWIQTYGPYGIYNYGGEQSDYRNVNVYDAFTTGGTAYVFSTDNTAAITSSFQMILTGGTSESAFGISGGSGSVSTNQGTGILFDAFTYDVHGFAIDQLYVNQGYATDAFLREAGTGGVRNLHVRGVQIEANGIIGSFAGPIYGSDIQVGHCTTDGQAAPVGGTPSPLFTATGGFFGSQFRSTLECGPGYSGTTFSTANASNSNIWLVGGSAVAPWATSISGITGGNTLTTTGPAMGSYSPSLTSCGSSALNPNSNSYAGAFTMTGVTSCTLVPGFTCPHSVICAMMDTTTPSSMKPTATTTTSMTVTATASDSIWYTGCGCL